MEPRPNQGPPPEPASGRGQDRRRGEEALPPGGEVFTLERVRKRWKAGAGFLLEVPELTITRGERVALVGYSGCGKSTLLDILAMILKPDEAGRFSLLSSSDGYLDVARAWEAGDLDRLARARMAHLGYVLQTGGLFPFISVRENIALTRRVLGLDLVRPVEELAGRLGIGAQLDKLPAQLSVGERQRVAIARAMAHEPEVVIADEPTASLDPINAEAIMALFTALAEESGVTLVVATHDWERVDEYGFRRIGFALEQEEGGQVRALVSS